MTFRTPVRVLAALVLLLGTALAAQQPFRPFPLHKAGSGFGPWGGQAPQGSGVRPAEAPPEPAQQNPAVGVDVVELRTRAVDPEDVRALPAIEQLGRRADDFVTVEILKSISRLRDVHPGRGEAAVVALLAIGERVWREQPRLAWSIGNDIRLSMCAPELHRRGTELCARTRVLAGKSGC